jgi:hypothetical protein
MVESFSFERGFPKNEEVSRTEKFPILAGVLKNEGVSSNERFPINGFF